MIADAFVDELEKIAGKPRYIQNLVEGGKRTNYQSNATHYIRGRQHAQGEGQTASLFMAGGLTTDAMRRAASGGIAKGESDAARRSLGMGVGKGSDQIGYRSRVRKREKIRELKKQLAMLDR